jgi:hypothetical protein
VQLLDEDLDDLQVGGDDREAVGLWENVSMLTGRIGRLTLLGSRAGHDAVVVVLDDEIALDGNLREARVVEVVYFGQSKNAEAVSILSTFDEKLTFDESRRSRQS